VLKRIANEVGSCGLEFEKKSAGGTFSLQAYLVCDGMNEVDIGCLFCSSDNRLR
jgi:hypothetical protein